MSMMDRSLRNTSFSTDVLVGAVVCVVAAVVWTCPASLVAPRVCSSAVVVRAAVVVLGEPPIFVDMMFVLSCLRRAEWASHQVRASCWSGAGAPLAVLQLFPLSSH